MKHLYDSSPPISDLLLEYLGDLLNADRLLDEAKEVSSSGEEQIGFVRGARYVLRSLKATQRMQEEDGRD